MPLDCKSVAIEPFNNSCAFVQHQEAAFSETIMLTRMRPTLFIVNAVHFAGLQWSVSRNSTMGHGRHWHRSCVHGEFPTTETARPLLRLTVLRLTVLKTARWMPITMRMLN